MYKKWRRITFCMILATLLFAIVGKFSRDGSIAQLIFTILAVALLLAASILEGVKCRCPSCRKYIRARRSYEYCPYCGADLED